MESGLIMDETDFVKLKSKDRDTLIYKNLLHQHTRLDNVESVLGEFKTFKLVTHLWLFLLTVAMGFKKWIPFI